jgi:hypothetical protein
MPAHHHHILDDLYSHHYVVFCDNDNIDHPFELHDSAGYVYELNRAPCTADDCPFHVLDDPPGDEPTVNPPNYGT